MDSNRKFIDFRKLWTLKGSKRHKCSNLASVKNTVERNKLPLKFCFINAGVNDIDNKEPSIIMKELVDIITLLRHKHPGIKIVISEITPRKDSWNRQVNEFNDMLRDLGEFSDVFLVDQSNLRNSDVSSTLWDDRHIHKRAIPRFAGNIKRALRKAYGYPEPYKANNRMRGICPKIFQEPI